jgi:DNA-directed RNA polymerase
MQPTIRDQLTLEERMVARGVTRYEGRQNRAEGKDRGAETDYARRLIAKHLVPLETGIQDFLSSSGPGRHGKARGLLQAIDAGQAAYFLLRGVFNSFTREASVQTVVSNIGRMVEDEIRFKKFKAQHEEYFETIIDDFKKKGTKNYRHMHRVLTFKANEKKDKWKAWSNEERAIVGSKLVEIMLECTELVEMAEVYKARSSRSKVNNKAKVLRPTEAAQDWIKRFSKYASMLDPDLMPCIIPPDPWTSVDQGGYYSPQLRSTTGLVLNLRKAQRALIEKGDISKVLRAINAVQATPWSVNKRVLEVMQTAWNKNLRIGMPASEPYVIPACPVPSNVKKDKMSAKQMATFTDWKREAAMLYTAEGERVSKCFQIARSLRMAAEYKQYDRFWFVYQSDFRGRIYAATSGLSPQGSDTAKALLHFSEGKQLGRTGMRWLAIHGANVYGYDKVSYAERADWVERNREAITRTAADPLSNRGFWGNADKPWCFLAFCFEWAEALAIGDTYVSHLPVALDGSCNGLQHFSALLRDPVGGAATNLRQSDKPADIYSTVGRVCSRALRAADSAVAREWVAFCDKHGAGVLPRSLAKKPVMTLPYGSTKRTCTDTIFTFIRETDKKFFSGGDFAASIYLTPLLWDSISDVVVSARVAMAFIQSCATRLAKAGKPMYWTTPLGFPVYQASYEIETKQIETQIAGRLRLRIGTFTDRLDVNKQRQGASPNFVHSMDATHHHMTLLASEDAGIEAFAMVHDSFGTHAADTEKLHRIIREQFVELYENCDPIAALIAENTADDITLPPAPKRGSLDIREVLASEFFFG